MRGTMCDTLRRRCAKKTSALCTKARGEAPRGGGVVVGWTGRQRHRSVGCCQVQELRNRWLSAGPATKVKGEPQGWNALRVNWP